MESGGGERELMTLVLAAALLFAELVVAGESSAGIFASASPMVAKAMFVLGDSSVDCGGNTLFYPFLHRNLSLFPCNGSNSDLIPYFLAAKMGLSNIPSFYSQSGNIEALTNGVNFGSAQATILFYPNNPSFQSLNHQIRQVYETLQLFALNVGPALAAHRIRSSIFYLSFGKEDLIRFLLHERNSTLPTTLRRRPRLFLQILANQMIRSIKYLYDGGVRKIVFMGMLPLGCAPRSVLEWYYATGRLNDTRGCIRRINRLVMEYNRATEQGILELKLDLPDAHIVFCDVYHGIMEIINEPGLYGFENERSGCCGMGWHHAAIGCISKEMACDEPSSHVWWDLYNPSRAVNSLLADSAWTGQPFADMCRPVTVQDLVYAGT